MTKVTHLDRIRHERNRGKMKVEEILNESPRKEVQIVWTCDDTDLLSLPLCLVSQCVILCPMANEPAALFHAESECI